MTSKRQWLIGAFGLLALGVLGCAGEDDIDRTQPNRLPKSMFQGTWYVRSTIIGVPGTSAASFVGYTGNMEKIRWEIQEDWLIAYRAYEEIPGTDTGGKAKTQDDPSSYKENPVAAYPILSQFDIKRQYNAATGEQTNVVEENSSDRPWHQRDYIRVDWSNSRVAPMTFDGVTGSSVYNTQYFVQQHENSEDAMRVINKDNSPVNFDKLDTVASNDPAKWNSVNYFDMVGKYMLETEKVKYQFEDGTVMDIPLCYFTMYAGTSYQTSSCGPTEVKVRTSFLKAGVRNFEPVPLPDREMAKFGYFRTERFTWDRKYGFSEAGRIYLANVYNIWEKAYEENPDGTLKVGADGNYVKIAMKDRTPKPIVYHINSEMPCELVGTSKQIAQSWNVSFRRAVAVAKGYLTETAGDIDDEVAKISKDKVPDMFVLNTNGWAQKTAGNDWSCANLQRDETKAEFLIGDLRYNTMYWVQDRQITGPLGYGPSSPDPETGEIISGVAHVYGAALDQYTNSSLEIVRMLNGDLDINNMITGDYVRDYIMKNQQVIDPAKIPRDLNNLKGKAIRDAFLTPKMRQRLDAIKSMGQNGLQRASYGERQRRLNRIQGTWLEEYMLDDEIIKGLAPNMLQGQAIGAGDTLGKEVRRLLSPTNWGTSEGMALDNLRVDRAARKNIWLAEFADDSIQGLAMEVWKKFGAKKDYDAMWQYLRERIYRGVTEHEVGHTVGLRHNFSGSYDSVNFYNKWWNLRQENLKERDPMRTDGAMGFADLYGQAKRTQAQIAGKITESQYSSIMDYGAKFNSDFAGIGKYDNAAILFGYTGNVEVFKNVSDDAKIVFRQRFSDCSSRYESTPNLAYAPILEQWHYSSVWNLLGKTKGIAERRFEKWENVKKAQDEAAASCNKYLAQGGTAKDFNQKQDGNRALEVPYMMCSDDYVGATVSCSRWDEGADPFEIANWVVASYKNYYFFNNFKRGRFGFNSYSLYSRLAGRYFSYLPMIYQNWLFRVAFTGGVQDDTLGNYWTIGTWNGFNLLTSIVQTPQYGTYCKGTDYDYTNYRCLAEANKPQRWFRHPSEMMRPQPGEIEVKQGLGRRRYSRFDYESGYYYQSQITEIGHFWEQLAAIEALTTSTGTFVGVETGTDFSRYLVPYYLLFDGELNNLFEGVISDDYKAYAPIVGNDGKVYVPPTATVAMGSGKVLDPATGEAYTPVQGLPLDLDNWFTIKFYMLMYGMSEFRSNFSLHFADRHQIFRVGSGQEVTPAPGMEVLTCQDPVRGHIYGTIYDPTWPEVEKGSAIKMINQCKAEVAKYNSTKNPRDRATMDNTIEWLNVLRGMYDIYGTNI